MNRGLHPLAKVRGRLDLTQEELAARSGVDVTTIRHIESGRTQRPRAQTLARLAQALDASVDDLLEVAS